MNTKFVLYVEDVDENVVSLKDEIDTWNEEKNEDGRRFHLVTAASYDEALDRLRKRRIDCALLDLRVPSKHDSRADAATGNRLATDVLQSCGTPMAILSGHIGDLDEGLSNSGPVEVFDKGEMNGFRDAVNWLESQWDMMHVLSLVRERIELSTSEVFAKRIWPQWKKLLEVSGTDEERLATIISRQFMSHAAEYLGLENQDNETWHPFENYVVPPLLDDRPHTGDIFELQDSRWIVLTPQCDMATGKVESVLLAKCTTGMEGFQGHVDAYRENKRAKSERFLRDLTNQNIRPSQHFLPPIPSEADPILVEFGSLKTISRTELAASLGSRLASVSPPFLGNLVQRFGAFMSRAGQPNIDLGNF